MVPASAWYAINNQTKLSKVVGIVVSVSRKGKHNFNQRLSSVRWQKKGFESKGEQI
jgi:hypothetical protein